MNTVRLVLATAALVPVLGASPRAQAQYALSLGTGPTLESGELGWGADARFGYRFGLGRRALVHTLIFQPEAGIGYLHLPEASADHPYLNALRASAGLRFGFLIGRFEPFAFAHVGVMFPNDYGNNVLTPVYDLGPAFDLRFNASSLGIHAAYELTCLNDAWCRDDRRRWLHFGVHYEIRWFSD